MKRTAVALSDGRPFKLSVVLLLLQYNAEIGDSKIEVLFSFGRALLLLQDGTALTGSTMLEIMRTKN